MATVFVVVSEASRGPSGDATGRAKRPSLAVVALRVDTERKKAAVSSYGRSTAPNGLQSEDRTVVPASTGYSPELRPQRDLSKGKLQSFPWCAEFPARASVGGRLVHR